ncbi:hypothetical protein QMM42_09940 [Leptospira santarosai]|nr:hypothetical protein [Leptospira santarosai]EMM77765.1 hypothetical protein LEP1GSC040_0737 [Leptospira santarosai str. 2000030832]MDI7186519.1 hypothetical protein [Leptospira santarosai]MDI7200601.1 hypothetical protein [Leptospira santarosai]MDI7206268.1 hypothetical protein [Leptospira santarosai]
MKSLHPQFITDDEGKKPPLSSLSKNTILEGLEDIRLYGEIKVKNEKPVP